MTAGTDLLIQAFRLWQMDQVPSSGANEPAKLEIIAALTRLAVDIGAAQAGLTTVATTAARDTFYATPANQGKLVYVNNNNGSATDPANGVYEYVSGAARLAQGFYAGITAVVQPLVNQAAGSAAAALASEIAAKQTILAPASYGVPLGSPINAGTVVQTVAATYRWQTPTKYDFVGNTFEIYNAGDAGLQVRLRMFNASGGQVASGPGYSGEKLLTLDAGYNIFDISDFFGSAGQFWGLYAQNGVLPADGTRKSTLGGYWSRTGNQTTGVNTLSNSDILHMFRFNVTEKVMSGAEYATSLRAAPKAVSTSYAAQVEHVYNGSSLNAGNHGETPPSLLLADYNGTPRDNVRNVAVGGRTVAQMLNAAAASLYPQLDAAFATGKIVVLHVDSGVIYNTVNNNSASSAANAAANIATAFSALLAGFATWKTAYPSLAIDLSDLPNVLGSSYWTPEHYTAFQATFQATAMNSGVVDYTTRISTVPETQDNTNGAFWNHA